ncbi:BZ3500_MvSof-1268-A1-R1_Chr4-2g07181 [Microbotryum saponariae]|uniref:BZ3500_MvSof-1268-A1-R1_Chr4-2g07181 protein n=1 Tax=Microbotryum saponariae TaxID=289078 RepID=A0A2X0KY39_9BASI|nr:BZ3500_MvSof-1268-A1-R1_Chr4-2g07181 [Microbotryum saponariae]SDA06846.1 BZ3501_MvSof-1269-A2-R1_Chr4-2g06892 [Microbotryum saponariae]
MNRLRSSIPPSSQAWLRQSFSTTTTTLTPASSIPNPFSRLPHPKAEFQVTPMGRFSALPNLAPRRGRSVVQRVGSTFGGTHRLEWLDRPRTVLVVCKKGDRHSARAAQSVIAHMRQHDPHLNIIVEEDLYSHLGETHSSIVLARPEHTRHLSSVVDFIVALGGDGTLLRVSSLFDDGSVPPVIGINTGTLGFMMPVRLDAFKQALTDVLENRASMLLRMRLQCELYDNGRFVDSALSENGDEGRAHIHAMNEITLHRGASPHLIYVDAQVDGAHLTEVVADGLLVSTPTGSTAYSLSSGGPIVHPSVQSLGVTAIAPRSLSFRTVLLPSDVAVQLSLSKRSRSFALLSLDGLQPRTLEPHHSLLIKMSPYPVPCIQSSPLSRLAEKGKEDNDPWVEDMRRMLRFNSPFREGR